MLVLSPKGVWYIYERTNSNFHDFRDVRTRGLENCSDILDTSGGLLSDTTLDQVACVVRGNLAGHEDLAVCFDSLTL